MNRLLILFILLVSFAFAQKNQPVDTLNIRYNQPRIKFSEMQEGKIIAVERYQMFSDPKIKTYAYRAINKTDADTFKCVLLELSNAWMSEYSSILEMTVSEARGLLDALNIAEVEYIGKKFIEERALMYTGRYFRFTIQWVRTNSGTPIQGKMQIRLTKRSLGMDGVIISESGTILRDSDLSKLKQALSGAILKYNSL